MSATVDPRSLVSFVERALSLKSLPVLRDASPDQIAAIIPHLRDRSFMPGATLFREGEPASEIHLVLEGKAALEGPALEQPIVRGPGELVGLLDALEQRPRAMTAVCRTAVHTTALRVDDLHELLEDFFELARSLVGLLARHVKELMGAGPPPFLDGDGAPFGGTGTMDLIDKIVFCKSVSLLAGASIDELVRLGKEASEVGFAAGDVVYRAGEPADAFYLVLRGRVAGHGPRAGVGALDVLGQGPYAVTAVAGEASRALRVPAERFFDLLEDHFDLTVRIARDLAATARRLHFEKHRPLELPVAPLLR